MTYGDLEYGLTAAVLASSMVGMGTQLVPRDFLAVLRAPLGVFLVLALQLLAIPPLARLLGAWFADRPGVAAGLLLVAAVPGGAYTNLFTYLARANVPLSVTATTVSTSLCVVTTPLIVQWYGADLLPGTLVMPVRRVFLEIGCWLLGPLAMGMALRQFAPRLRRVVGKHCIRASLTLMAVVVLLSLVSGRVGVRAQGMLLPVVLFLFAWGVLWMCYLAGLATRRRGSDMYAIAIEVMVRNTGLALLLKASLFPDGQHLPEAAGVLYVIVAYSAVALVLAGLEVFAARGRRGPIYSRPDPVGG